MRISDWSSDVCSSDLAFSAGARERFLSDLVWGSKGLGGFNRGDLAEDLGDDQIRAVLGLFGSDMVAYAPPSRAAGIGIDRIGLPGTRDLERRDRKSVVEGKSVSVRRYLGGVGIIKNK